MEELDRFEKWWEEVKDLLDPRPSRESLLMGWMACAESRGDLWLERLKAEIKAEG